MPDEYWRVTVSLMALDLLLSFSLLPLSSLHVNF